MVDTCSFQPIPKLFQRLEKNNQGFRPSYIHKAFERLIMAKTLKDLLLALLNATLILVALCLFLGWKLASTVEDVTSGLTEKLQVVTPLRDEAQGIREQLSGLRRDLARIQEDGQGSDSAASLQISATLDKLDTIETKLQAVQTRFTRLAESPDQLMDQAIRTSADVLADRILTIRGCGSEG